VSHVGTARLAAVAHIASLVRIIWCISETRTGAPHKPGSDNYFREFRDRNLGPISSQAKPAATSVRIANFWLWILDFGLGNRVESNLDSKSRIQNQKSEIENRTNHCFLARGERNSNNPIA
jgi:hypothetical protein